MLTKSSAILAIGENSLISLLNIFSNFWQTEANIYTESANYNYSPFASKLSKDYGLAMYIFFFF
jgi:hypothetical protein